MTSSESYLDCDLDKYPKMKSDIRNRIYICGPMTGYPEHNFPAFEEAQEIWEGRGYRVVNPARLDDGDTSKSRHYYMQRDLPLLIGCDSIALLPGWSNSEGAGVEVVVAVACGMVAYHALARHPILITLAVSAEGTPLCDV